MKNFTKTILASFLLVFVMASAGWGQAILYEDFNYTAGDNIGGNTNTTGGPVNNWYTHSNNKVGTINVIAGSLSYTGLQTSTGNKILLPGDNTNVPRDVNRAFTSTATVVYFSILLSVVDNTQLGTSGDYFMSFGATSGTAVTSLGARLGIKSANAGANYRLAIQNISGGTPTYTDFATDLVFGTTYLVVVKYDRSASPTVASLWVNPSSLGGSEPGGQVTNNSGTGTFAAFASICLRNSSGTPKAHIDEIRTGTAWADVTPGGTTPTITLSSPSQVTSGNADQGATNLVLSNFQAAITTANSTLNSLAFTSAGTYTDTDLQNMKLYFNATSNTFSGATQIGSTLTTSLGTGTHTFSGLTQGINNGTTGYFWITCDISGTATVGNTINAAANPVLTFASGTPTGTITAGGVKTITEAVPDINISANHPAGGSINQNSTDNILYSIQLDVTKANATLTGLTVTTAGTYNVSDLQANSFKFWINSANNLTGAVQLGTGQAITGSGSDISVSGLTQSVPIGTRYLLVTASVAYNANTSRNISIASTILDNIVFLSGVKFGSDPVSAGNTFTFAEVVPGIAITNLGPSAGTINPPSANNILYKLSFAVTNNTTEFTSITLTTAGTYQVSDFTANSFKLWINTVNNFGTASVIGTGSVPVSGSGITFASLNQLITSGSTAYVWLTADVEAAAVIGRTVSITSTAFTNITFSAGTKTGTDPAAAGGTLTFSGLPSMTELVVPQYLGSKTAASTNNARTPLAICLRIDNLNPSTAYDVKVMLALTSEAATVYGAGNIWDGAAFSASNITNAFTTDVNGSSGAFWVYLQPTGNATRFDAGQVHNLRVGYVTTGGSMPSAPNFVGAKTITALDIATTERTVSTADDGAFIKGYGFSGSTGKYALLFDNTTGTGNPIFSTQIRTSTYTNTTQSDLPTAINDVFRQAGTSSIGDFAAVIPIGANNPNGIRRIEVRNADNTLYFAQTDENGNWQAHHKTGSLIRRQADSVAFYSVNIKLAFQGFYDTGNNRLALGDTVKAYLASVSSPHTLVDSSTSVVDSMDFTANFIFKNSTPSASYYLIVKHRSSIETWSALGVSFINDKALFYDFTTGSGTAFGSNLILVGPKYCIYSGDINQDGTVDLNDVIPVLSDYDNLDYHLINDLNFDGTIDLNDAIFVLSGYDNLVGVVTPAKMSPLRRINVKIDRKEVLEKIESINNKQKEKPSVKN